MTFQRGIDCVGYEAHSCTPLHSIEPAAALNSVIDAVKFGGLISIPGCYFQQDPGATREEEQRGEQYVHLGKAWEKGIQIVGMGQHPNIAYNEHLLKEVLSGKTQWAKHMNVTVGLGHSPFSVLTGQVVSMADAVNAYSQFREGAAVKFFIDPHGVVDQPHQSVAHTTTMQAMKSKAQHAWQGAKHSIEGAVGSMTDKLRQIVEK